MSNDDILCEAPGPGGRTCTRPYGHQPEGAHAFDVELPHDLAHIIEGIMQSTEQARAGYVQAARRARRSQWLALVLIAVYFGLIVWETFLA
jgi:hypothetical protein